MPRDQRLFMTFPIDFWTHPKVSRLSDAAFRAFVEANGHSRMRETDGVLEADDAEFLWKPEVLAELVASHPSRPLMVRLESGEYLLRDYAEHQFTKADRDALSEKRATAARIGAEKRAKAQQVPASAEQVPSTREQSPAGIGKEIELEKEKIKNVSAPAALDRAFDEAWSHWPKKVERKKASDQWRVAVRKLGVDAAVECVTRFGDAYAATTEKQFVPALGVWLRGERWTDELPQRRADNRGSQSEKFHDTLALGREVQAELDALGGFELKGIA